MFHSGLLMDQCGASRLQAGITMSTRGGQKSFVQVVVYHKISLDAVVLFEKTKTSKFLKMLRWFIGCL